MEALLYLKVGEEWGGGKWEAASSYTGTMEEPLEVGKPVSRPRQPWRWQSTHETGTLPTASEFYALRKHLIRLNVGWPSACESQPFAL